MGIFINEYKLYDLDPVNKTIRLVEHNCMDKSFMMSSGNYLVDIDNSIYKL